MSNEPRHSSTRRCSWPGIESVAARALTAMVTATTRVRRVAAALSPSAPAPSRRAARRDHAAVAARQPADAAGAHRGQPQQGDRAPPEATRPRQRRVPHPSRRDAGLLDRPDRPRKAAGPHLRPHAGEAHPFRRDGGAATRRHQPGARRPSTSSAGCATVSSSSRSRSRSTLPRRWTSSATSSSCRPTASRTSPPPSASTTPCASSTNG